MTLLGGIVRELLEHVFQCWCNPFKYKLNPPKDPSFGSNFKQVHPHYSWQNVRVKYNL